jgi:hypothetical protein
MERIVDVAGTTTATYQPSTGESWVIQAVALRCK